MESKKLTRDDFLKTESIWITILAVYLGSAILIAIAGLMPFGLLIWSAVGLLSAALIVMQSGSKSRRVILIIGLAFLVICFWKTDISLQRGFVFQECLILLCLYYMSRQASHGEILWPVKKLTFAEVLYYLAAGTGLYFVSTYINSISMLFFGNKISGMLEAQKDSPAAMIVIFCILPAISEEVLFRGLIYGSLQGRRTKILLSALLFALYHMNFNQISYAFFMGAALAFFRMESRNLLPCVLMHFTLNLISVLSVCIPAFHTFTENAEIMGWKPFGMALRQKGVISPLTLGSGACFSVVILVILLIGLKVVIKDREKTCDNAENAAESAASWKTSFIFYLGCALCLAAAVLAETGL